jgi:hypothetical protein
MLSGACTCASDPQRDPHKRNTSSASFDWLSELSEQICPKLQHVKTAHASSCARMCTHGSASLLHECKSKMDNHAIMQARESAQSDTHRPTAALKSADLQHSLILKTSPSSSIGTSVLVAGDFSANPKAVGVDTACTTPTHCCAVEEACSDHEFHNDDPSWQATDEQNICHQGHVRLRAYKCVLG